MASSKFGLSGFPFHLLSQTNAGYCYIHIVAKYFTYFIAWNDDSFAGWNRHQWCRKIRCYSSWKCLSAEMETVWKNRANEICGHYYTSAKEWIRVLASAVSWFSKKGDWWQEQLKEFPPSSSSFHAFFQPTQKITLCSGQSIRTKVPVVLGAEHRC